MKKMILILILTILISLTSAECVNISLNRGWNLISTPVQNSTGVSTLFPHIITPMYRYESTNYIIDDHLEIGKAYWILNNENENVTICGEPVYEFCIDLQRGWNAIGAPFNEVTDLPDGISSLNLYVWDGTNYHLTDHLEPTKGYWILAETDLTDICFGEDEEIEGCINSCEDITEPGEYVLCGNITANPSLGKCIEITTNNVTLDCLGYKMNGNSTATPSYTTYDGIKINNKNDITIKNCEISNFGNAIDINTLRNSKIDNNILKNCYFHGIKISNPNKVNITNNNISNINDEIDETSYDYDENGIFIYNGGSNLLIQNNTIDNCKGYGIFNNATGSYNNNIFDNNLVNLSLSGYKIQQQNNLTFINNIGNNNENRGIYLWQNNGFLKNNTFLNNLNEGILNFNNPFTDINESISCNNDIDINIVSGGYSLSENTCDTHYPSDDDICEFECSSRSRPMKVDIDLINEMENEIKQKFKNMETNCFIVKRQEHFEICCEEIQDMEFGKEVKIIKKDKLPSDGNIICKKL